MPRQGAPSGHSCPGQVPRMWIYLRVRGLLHWTRKEFTAEQTSSLGLCNACLWQLRLACLGHLPTSELMTMVRIRIYLDWSTWVSLFPSEAGRGMGHCDCVIDSLTRTWRDRGGKSPKKQGICYQNKRNCGPGGTPTSPGLSHCLHKPSVFIRFPLGTEVEDQQRDNIYPLAPCKRLTWLYYNLLGTLFYRAVSENTT